MINMFFQNKLENVIKSASKQENGFTGPLNSLWLIKNDTIMKGNLN